MGPRRIPTVTVAIPCFNYGRYLGEAIQSALDQEPAPLEVLVIDDGSTDDTADVVACWGDKVRYVPQPNSGLPAARNRGARESVGECIVFLDADDRLGSGYLEQTLKAISGAGDRGYAFAYTHLRCFGRENQEIRVPEFSTLGLLTDNYVHASALIWTELVRQCPYDERLRSGFEDWDFYLTLCEHGHIGVLADGALLMYRKHDVGSSMYDSLHRWRRELLRSQIAWKHRGLYARYRTVGARRFARRSIDALRGRG